MPTDRWAGYEGLEKDFPYTVKIGEERDELPLIALNYNDVQSLVERNAYAVLIYRSTWMSIPTA